MNAEELLDCLKRLSKTNNFRDGIDIKKEEANIIVNEIERLNNIINELGKWLKEEYEATIFDYHNAIEDVLNKLQELKGSDKE